MRYRVRRRAFLSALGGAFGFSSLLSNLEASAEGVGPPPRFLLLFWPCGTIPYLFRPTGSGRSYVPSALLAPFEQAGLREDMSLFYGLRDAQTPAGGGGHEAGVVYRTTGANSPGTRKNQGEADDAVAGGPSFDQIFGKHVPALADRGAGPVNAIADARVDSFETSAQCLSYAYEQRQIPSMSPGTEITENVPLLPELRPAKLYAQLFSGFMPGGNSDANRLELAKALQLRKSVLDYSLGQLKELRGLSPSSEREKLDIHADAIRKLERQLAEQPTNGSCDVPVAPDPELAAMAGSSVPYGSPEPAVGDSDHVAEVGKQHLAVIRAAFQCDLTRVATFQWASACDHVAFTGLHPGDPTGTYLHHPMTHRVDGARLDQAPADVSKQQMCEFLGNVQAWYNQRTAEALTAFKNTRDIFGGSLLDYTIAPFVTDVAQPNHARQPLPAMVFGGRALGMQGGQYFDFVGNERSFNDLWLSVAQAYLPTSSDIAGEFSLEAFMKQGVGLSPIAGVWRAPQ